MKQNKDVQGRILGEWARNTFNMTAECEPVEDIPEDENYSPCKTRLSQIQSLHIDQQLLCNFCQMHECNGFCLRTVKIPKQQNNEERVSKTENIVLMKKIHDMFFFHRLLNIPISLFQSDK
jgi:hypothetical protein